ncbi:putative membrane protein [Bosea sp. 124]|nr:DoxX family protein [Bosea sp. 124]PTM43256.1 putative membrane protein [Bosea sp. 124]
MRWLMSAFYGGAGLLHLVRPDGFLPIVPAWVPEPRMVVIATGVAEILGALGLLVPPLRKAAGLGLALYALCVLPANIKHAAEGIVLAGLPSSWWYHAPRLALQPVLIWGTLYAGGVIDWPWRQEGKVKLG